MLARVMLFRRSPVFLLGAALAWVATLAVGEAARGKITAEDRDWWAFRPVTTPAVPQGEAHPVDAFLLERLRAEGLDFAPEAPREVLVRRLWFDVLGLPPTAEETAAFLEDRALGAWERLVDRALASPRHGERQARLWLDLVRHADSDGYKADDYRPDAWRYRDWVIAAFNDDKPYDRFILEQLAGDELFPDDPKARIATGYLRCGIYEYNNRDAAGQWEAMLNDITDTTSDVFLGLGLQCARCHDHKFDPLLQKDYYRLQAFFAGLEMPEQAPVAAPADLAAWQGRQRAWEAATADIRARIDAVEAPWRDKARADALSKFPPEIQEILTKAPEARTPRERPVADIAWRQVTYEWARLDGRIKGRDKETLAALRRELAAFDHLRPAPLPSGLVVREFGQDAPDTLIPRREREGAVAPGFPVIFDDAPAAVTAAAHSTGRRSALARWIASPANPLTARVMVNRVWQQHFGQGLSTTASDVGRLGDTPSHPALLDWLASRFVADGWSLRKLHRLILTSRAWRQGTASPHMEQGRLVDPANRLLWRWNTRRLESEQIRDAIFSATGELDLAAGGPGVDLTKPRRSVYVKVLRNVRDPLMEVFDTPQHFNSTPQRDTTTTAVQSLFLANSRFMQERAAAMAADLAARHGEDDAALVADAWQRTAGRPPATDEREDALAFLRAAAAAPPQPLPGGGDFIADAMPQRDGRAAVLAPGSPQERLVVSPSGMALPESDFTIEAVVLLRSIFPDGTVRTIAAQWDGAADRAGWALGITGEKSRRKPRMPVLQLAGTLPDGRPVVEPVFSDIQIQLDRSYYIAASVRYGAAGEASVTFHVKDLANDDEPLQTSVSAHPFATPIRPAFPLVIGDAHGSPRRQWDGLIDEVRIRRGIPATDALALTRPEPGPDTVACWQFEPSPGFRTDSVSRTESITAPDREPAARRAAAVTDFCHALLSSSAFLYLE